MLKNVNRSDSVGLGLEVLLQSLAQEDSTYRAVAMKVTQCVLRIAEKQCLLGCLAVLCLYGFNMPMYFLWSRVII